MSLSSLHLTDHTDQTDQELIQSRRSFSYRQDHALEVVLEEDAWYPLSMFKRSRVVGHGVLTISEASLPCL